MEAIRNIKEEKKFRIWLMENLDERRLCHRTNFCNLYDNIISTFSLSTVDTYELRNGLDGTIIHNDYDFSHYSSNTIFILLNKSKNEEWADSIGHHLHYIILILAICQDISINRYYKLCSKPVTE
ncbi:hypothetical protein KUTeg_015334 [Tegillarca granosa]|uniref:Uncharacterized protein n=1 Tax=Tegillarca granosa TaxID=220873 RepID=A0ABQ9EQ06_TEGGR|nr:hypothetical protein KUTeg_015334 [Tegillarca granosa]